MKLPAAFALAAMLAFASLTAGCETQDPPPPGFERVRINGESFDLELAIDHPSREEGLKGRENIPADQGMLFVFPDVDKRSFWMHNCLAPIDIIYLDPTGRVTATHQMKVELKQDGEAEAAYQRRLTRYGSKFAAKYVIELKGGRLEDLDVQEGQEIKLDHERLKALAK
ncbi:MAG: hypothetical protein CMJ31_03525 [Phycisphaerae bacterium]|nr:hypothetical protein [Phycisphaerae bacterium]